MKWYISKLVFKISVEDTKQKPQFDEQLRLIAADSAEQAFLKARKIGIAQEDSFLNDHKNIVEWEFINVAEMMPLNKLEDGMEIYSQIHETEEERAYIHCIHQKAIFLRTHTS